MKNAHLAGILNVVIPGAGMIYLGKWREGLFYFLGVPFFLIFYKSALDIFANIFHEYVQSNTLFFYYLVLNNTVLYLIMLAYMVWDAFITPYCFAKNINLQKKAAIAILLNFISFGLGFFYLKAGWEGFLNYLWMLFMLAIARFTNNIIFPQQYNGVNLLFSILTFCLIASGYVELSSNAYKIATKHNKQLEKTINESESWNPNLTR